MGFDGPLCDLVVDFGLSADLVTVIVCEEPFVDSVIVIVLKESSFDLVFDGFNRLFVDLIVVELAVVELAVVDLTVVDDDGLTVDLVVDLG